MKKSWKALGDAVTMAWRMEPTALLWGSVGKILGAIVPFIAIWLSAYVVDQLSGNASLETMVPVVFLGVGLAFACDLISKYANRVYAAQIGYVYCMWEKFNADKTLSLDYPQLEDPQVAALRDRVFMDKQWSRGIFETFAIFPETLGTLTRILCSLVILGPMLRSVALLGGGSTLGFIALVAILTIGPMIYAVTHEKARAKEYQDFVSSRHWKLGYYLYREGLKYPSGKDVRIFGAQPMITRETHSSVMRNQLWGPVCRASHAMGLGGALNKGAEALIMGGAYLFAALVALTGGLGLGAVVRAAAGFYQLAQALATLCTGISSFIVDTQRLQSQFEYMNLPPVLYKGTLPIEKRRDNRYFIEFHDVSFQYPGTQHYALRNLNLAFEIGQRMAVVGPNGSGKTTMIKLLCRLYDPTSGHITLNGIDIRKYDYHEYLGIFSVVFQDFALLSLTLGENVASAADYDAPRVQESLAKAGFQARSTTLPKGLNTPLYKNFDANGIEISGGEAQKIALARALYKAAPFVILDEPTAALDPIAEHDIYTRFNEIVGSRTAVYISHRLSSCRFCQDIAVFDEGQLIQRGSHEGLLADKKGKYHALWHAQAQYYQEEGNAGALPQTPPGK